MSPSCYLLISVATRLKSKALTLRTYVTYTCLPVPSDSNSKPPEPRSMSEMAIFQQLSTSTPACEKLWAWGIERSVSQQRATEWQYLDRTARSSFTTLIAAFGAQS
jgi:hypothetical protein